MKICWDNLEKLIYNRKRGKWRDKYWHYYIYKEKCIICGEPFLSRQNEKANFCSLSCNPMKIKVITDEYRERLSMAHKGKQLSKEHRELVNL